MEGQGVYSPKEQYKQMFIEAVGKRPGSMVLWRVLDELAFSTARPEQIIT